MTESSIPRFFEKDIREKLNIIADFSNLSEEEMKILGDATGGLDFETANKMIENAIGTFALPLGIATNFRIDENDIDLDTIMSGIGRIRDVAQSDDGYIYIITSNTDGKGFPDDNDDKLLRILK